MPVAFRSDEVRSSGLLGASGCGKSTLLNLIAGFETPDAGAILLRGKPINAVPPHRRNVAMVFQNYAMFPHLTVAQNIAYGLHARKLNRAAIRARRRGNGRLAAAERPWPPLSGAVIRRPAPARRRRARLGDPAPTCCCWMRRSAHWTAICEKTCNSSCLCCCADCMSPRSSLRTTSARRSRWLTVSQSCRGAASSQIGTPEACLPQPEQQ